MNWSSRRFKRGKLRFVCRTDIHSNRKCGFRRFSTPTYKRWGRNLDGDEDLGFELPTVSEEYELLGMAEDQDYIEYSDLAWI